MNATSSTTSRPALPAGPPLAARMILPWWLTPLVAVWLSLAFFLVVDAAAARLPIQVLVALLAGLAIVHGLAHRRWRIAGPLAGLAVITIAGLIAADDALQLDVGPDPGQSGLDGWTRLIWIVAALTWATVTALAVVLHRRSARAAVPVTADLRGRERRHAATRSRISASLTGLDAHITAIERLLKEAE